MRPNRPHESGSAARQQPADQPGQHIALPRRWPATARPIINSGMKAMSAPSGVAMTLSGPFNRTRNRSAAASRTASSLEKAGPDCRLGKLCAAIFGKQGKFAGMRRQHATACNAFAGEGQRARCVSASASKHQRRRPAPAPRRFATSSSPVRARPKAGPRHSALPADPTSARQVDGLSQARSMIASSRAAFSDSASGGHEHVTARPRRAAPHAPQDALRRLAPGRRQRPTHARARIYAPRCAFDRFGSQ